jgi:hypothetical protein
LPSVTLSASYGEGLDFDSRTRLALFGVSIPLPFWNRREGDLEAARAEVARQQAERERVLARIDKEVTTAFRQFLTARQVVEEYVQQIVPAQEQNARLVEQSKRGPPIWTRSPPITRRGPSYRRRQRCAHEADHAVVSLAYRRPRHPDGRRRHMAVRGPVPLGDTPGR